MVAASACLFHLLKSSDCWPLWGGAGTCVILAAFSDAEVEDMLTRKAAMGNCLMQASRELTRLQFNADVPGGWIFFLVFYFRNTL